MNNKRAPYTEDHTYTIVKLYRQHRELKAKQEIFFATLSIVKEMLETVDVPQSILDDIYNILGDE